MRVEVRTENISLPRVYPFQTTGFCVSHGPTWLVPISSPGPLSFPLLFQGKWDIISWVEETLLSPWASTPQGNERYHSWAHAANENNRRQRKCWECYRVSKICQYLIPVKRNSTYLLVDYIGSNFGLFLIRKAAQKNL